MVPCHIYGIWRSRGGGRFEVIWGVGRKGSNVSLRGCNFNGEGGWGSHYM